MSPWTRRQGGRFRVAEAGGVPPRRAAPGTPRAAGFTLIEILVGIAVLGLASAAAAVVMRVASDMIGENSLHGKAIARAQEAMEDLRMLPYDDMQSGDGASDDGVIAVHWEVRPNDPEKGMKMVVVSAVWTWKGAPRSYVLKTVYSKVTRR